MLSVGDHRYNVVKHVRTTQVTVVLQKEGTLRLKTRLCGLFCPEDRS